MIARRHCEAAKPTWQSMGRFAGLAVTLAMPMLLVAPACAGDAFDLLGHTKWRLVGQYFDEDSLFRDIAGSTAVDAAGELRLNLTVERAGWALQADYQLIGAYSEFLPAGLPSDDERLLDLTHVFHDGGDNAMLHRLDRLWVSYTGDKTVVRFGRQALTWGNGLFFTPMDRVNPFDPTTIDTEYKTGDDMLYAQYLRDNGDDLQAAVVFRRDPSTGDAERDAGTTALKYHGFAGETEYDLLLAEDRGDSVIGIGGVRSVGGAVVRADLVVTDAPGETVTEFVANLSYSWVWDEKNVSAAAEYYYDDGTSYVAGSLMIEMSPLWLLTPTVVANADDPSALIQIVTQYSLSDNMSFLASLNIPAGADGTEYGGPESGVPGRYLSFEAGVFAQLAWYF